jgi:hypothetical protein
MQPDHPVACFDLAMHASAAVIVFQPPGSQSEHASQVGVSSGDVVVDQDCNPALNGAVEHDHFLHRFDEFRRRLCVVAGERRDHFGESSPQLSTGRQLVIGELEVAVQRMIKVPPGMVERLRDLFECEPDPAQQANAVQPADVFAVIESLPSTRMARRRPEPDLVVIAQRADGESGPVGEFADLQTCLLHSHGGNART